MNGNIVMREGIEYSVVKGRIRSLMLRTFSL
jgi:hypothetical protein